MPQCPQASFLCYYVCSTWLMSVCYALGVGSVPKVSAGCAVGRCEL